MDEKQIDIENNNVSARNLYDYIYNNIDHVNKERFSKWFERQKIGFIDGVDYIYVNEVTRTKKEGKRIVNRKMFDYSLSIDMAINIIIGQSRLHDMQSVLQDFLNKYSKLDNVIKFYTIPRKEIQFFNDLEEVLKPLGMCGIRQYYIKPYRIDYFIPKINLAIEYDEKNHLYYTFEEQELRQNKIEDLLKCTFVRLSDSNSNLYNIGIVIKKIFSI